MTNDKLMKDGRKLSSHVQVPEAHPPAINYTCHSNQANWKERVPTVAKHLKIHNRWTQQL